MDSYLYNLRPPEDVTPAIVAAKHRKNHKYFDRQIRYLNTKEFRTGFTPVLPFDDPNKIVPGTGETIAAPRLGRLPPLPARPRKAHNTKVAPMPLVDGDTAPDVRSHEELRAIVDSFCVEKHRSRRREMFQNEAGNEEARHNGRHRRRKEKESTERQAGTTRRKIKRLFSKKKLQKDLENLAFPVQEKESKIARSTVVAPRHLPGGGTQSQVKSVAELDHILSTHSSGIPVGTSAAVGKLRYSGDTTPDGSPRGDLISALLSADDSSSPREGGQVRQTSSGTGGEGENTTRGTLQHIRKFADRYFSHKDKPTKTKINPRKDRESAGVCGALKKGPTKTKVEAFSECDVDVPRQRGLWSRLFH